jgi:hypothetical protein
MYQYDCAEGQEEKAEAEFLKTLRREPTETTEAMQNGIDFENAVNDYLKSGEKTDDERWGDTYLKVAEQVRGGQYQVRAYKEKTIAGVDFLLYAKCDFVKAGKIIDTKFVGKYEVGKYLNSPQHPFYLEVIDNAYAFDYLVSDGKDVFKETYHKGDLGSIVKTIELFVRYLKSYGFWSIYSDKWVSNGN